VQVENSFSVWQFADEKPEDEHIREQFGAVQGGGGVSDPTAIPFEQHQANIEAFIKAIEGKEPFEIDGREARKAVEIILRIYASAGIK
jgi:predicted dehydrogenase